MSGDNLYLRYSNSFYDTLADKMKKQKYLVDNILNKGYDKLEFTTYMINQRENGADIDNWTYEELVNMVKMFKRRHTSNLVGSEMYDDGFSNFKRGNQTKSSEGEEEAKKLPSEKDYNECDDSPNVDSPKLSRDFSKDRTLKLNNKMSHHESDEDYNVGTELEPEIPNIPNASLDKKSSTSTAQGEYEVIGDQQPRVSIVKRANFNEEDKENQEFPAKRSVSMKLPATSKTDKGYSELSQLKKKNLSAKVSEGLVCKDGFFSFSYASYKIEIYPIGWKVRRKENDFVFLRQYLRKKYPQHFVPPLVLTNERLSNQALMKKEKYFTRFLINILRNQDLRGSYFLQEFLSIESQEAFEKLVEQRRLEAPPQKLGEYTTLHGKANTKSETTAWQFCYNIPEFSKQYEDLNHCIASTSKRLVGQFKNLTHTMEELSSYFDDLGELYTETDSNMVEINKTISTLLASWSNSFEGQSNILRNWFPRFFKYNMNEYKSMTEMLDHRNITKDNFVRMQTDLEQLKTKLYAERDFAKWELSNDDQKRLDELDQDEYLAKSRMLPEQTQALNNRKLLLNYLNNTMESEIKRVLRYNYKDLKGHFLRIADQQCQILTDMQVVWSEFIAHYVEEKEVSSDEEYISCFDPIRRMKTSESAQKSQQA